MGTTQRERNKRWSGWRTSVCVAWIISQSMLDHAITEIGVLLYCAKMLAIKTEQDFEELSRENSVELHDSLMVAFEVWIVSKSLWCKEPKKVPAIGTLRAHADGSFW